MVEAMMVVRQELVETLQRTQVQVAAVPVAIQAEQAVQVETALRALSAFVTRIPLHSQHQQQDRRQLQHQAVTEFTNGQEAGA
jgi:septal ring factor EnvC (AmiA/AmiB activator)